MGGAHRWYDKHSPEAKEKSRGKRWTNPDSLQRTGRQRARHPDRNEVTRSMARNKTAPLVVMLGTVGLLLANSSEVPGGPASLEPCSVLSAEEASEILNGPVKQEVPSPIRYKGISTGGTCMYRLQKDSNKTITVQMDATPTGAQKRRFEAGLRHARGGEFSGIGDRAYFESQVMKKSEALTFLRGETLTTVTVTGLGAEDAKKVAALVVPRLPTSVIEPPAPPPAQKGSGKLDPALVGSWFLRQPSGRSIANLDIHRSGTFAMMVSRGAKMIHGNVDGDDGVLHLYPEGGGYPQEIKYKVVDKNQMEWIDQKGNVTIARRQFR